MHSALNHNFAQRTPVAPNKKLIFALVAIILGTVISSLSLWVIKSDKFLIKHMHIEGEFISLDTEDIRALVNTQIRGSGFFGIDANVIHDALVALPWIKKASVLRIWPDSLKVIITEQLAFVRWGETGFLNEQGDYFEPNQDTSPTSLPILEGATAVREILLDHFKYLQAIPKLNVTRLRLDQRRAWEMELDNKLLVVLGKENFEDRVELFINTARPNLGENLSQVERIDMRYTNGFSVQWKQAPKEHLVSENRRQ